MSHSLSSLLLLSDPLIIFSQFLKKINRGVAGVEGLEKKKVNRERENDI